MDGNKPVVQLDFVSTLHYRAGTKDCPMLTPIPGHLVIIDQRMVIQCLRHHARHLVHFDFIDVVATHGQN